MTNDDNTPGRRLPAHRSTDSTRSNVLRRDFILASRALYLQPARTNICHGSSSHYRSRATAEPCNLTARKSSIHFTNCGKKCIYSYARWRLRHILPIRYCKQEMRVAPVKSGCPASMTAPRFSLLASLGIPTVVKGSQGPSGAAESFEDSYAQRICQMNPLLPMARP